MKSGRKSCHVNILSIILLTTLLIIPSASSLKFNSSKPPIPINDSCKAITNQFNKDTCYNHLAMSSDDYSYCSKILKDGLGVEPELCYMNFAEANNVYSPCYELESNIRLKCISKVHKRGVADILSKDTFLYLLRLKTSYLIIAAFMVLLYLYLHSKPRTAKEEVIRHFNKRGIKHINGRRRRKI